MARNLHDFEIKAIKIPSFNKPLNNSPKKSARKIDKNTRDVVWLKYMGNNVERKCYCCRVRTIHITDFQVGHNKSISGGGDDNISNLRPICGPCNRGMGTMSIERYKKKYFGGKSIKKVSKKTSAKKKKPINRLSFFSGGSVFNSRSSWI